VAAHVGPVFPFFTNTPSQGHLKNFPLLLLPVFIPGFFSDNCRHEKTQMPLIVVVCLHDYNDSSVTVFTGSSKSVKYLH